MTTVAINGFGRIGRVALRAILTHYLDRVKVAAVNTSGSMSLEGWQNLFERDSVYGRFKGKIEMSQGEKEGELGVLTINHQRIPFLAEREPAKIPWKRYGVDVVLESTGAFKDRQAVKAHLDAGAKKVAVSAPCKGVETFVVGVNHQDYRGELVVSNASCTTNCVAPVMKVIMDRFGVQKAFLTTVHAYTSTQNLVDNSHKDWRRARAAALNIIPASTGAAIATAEVLPSLKGVFDGLAFRVPVACGSVIDLTLSTLKRTSAEEVNQVLREAAEKELRGILAVSEAPLVSSDIVGESFSALVDANLTQVVDGDLVKLVAWYDNEWAYACRLIELAEFVNRS